MNTVTETLTEDTMFEPDSAAPRVLVADDQADVLEALRLLLKAEGYEIETVTSPEAVIRSLEARDFDVLLLDLNYARDTTSGAEGLDLLARIQAVHRDVPVVVMTAWSSVQLAIETMRRGVRDFVEKPWDNARVLATLKTQVDRSRNERERRHLALLELEAAAETERGLLPREIPQIPGFEIAAHSRPMRAIGGDYFDARKTGHHTLALAIGDVSGKGMAAALLMSNLQAAVKACSLEGLAPARLCAQVNSIIHGNLAAEKFITFFYARLDVASRTLAYANAGHNAPVLVRRDGTVRRLSPGGPVLGVFADSRYEESSIELAPGDRLVLFTDGITEVTDASGAEFGEESLIALLVQERASSAEDLRDQVLRTISAFSGPDFQDDATLIIVAAQ